jgi:general secretion pathway protein K
VARSKWDVRFTPKADVKTDLSHIRRSSSESQFGCLRWLTACLIAPIASSVRGNIPQAIMQSIFACFVAASGNLQTAARADTGRIDIGKASPDLLAALLRSVGASQSQAGSVAQSIVAWRDRKDDRSINNNPPSTAGTNANASANSAHDAFLTDVSQIAEVPGMRPDWLAAIRPLATVFGAETVNPLTAPAGVIASLPGVDRDRLEAFLAARRSFPNDAARLGSILGSAQRFIEAKPQQVVSVQIAATLGDGYAASARAVIVLLPHDSEPYRVLVWTPLSPSAVL